MSNQCFECCSKPTEQSPYKVIFNKAGEYQWLVPKNGWFKVYVTGAGGGSGMAHWPDGVDINGSVVSGAGGGGGTAIKDLYLKKGEWIDLSVGEGGSPGTGKGTDHEVTAGQGGSSSFGTYCSATGGKGGRDCVNTTYACAVTCGGGGKGINGDRNIYGSIGYAYGVWATNQYIPPTGGGSFWGPSGIDFDILQPNSSWNGQTPDVYGCGASGAGVRNQQTPTTAAFIGYGGKGADGVVMIEWTEVQ